MNLLRFACAIVMATPALAFQMPAGFNVCLQSPAQVEVPSPSYPAAAGQVGIWNPMWITGQAPPLSSGLLLDVDGSPSGVSIEIVQGFTHSFSSNSFYTYGDDHLLLDDGVGFGTQSGFSRFHIHGLAPGDYILFTYGLVPDSWGGTAVRVEGVTKQTALWANFSQGFAEGITHTVHTFTAHAGVPEEVYAYAYGLELSGEVSGFQIIPADGVPAHRYCESNVNSTGNNASMTFAGSASRGSNDLQLGVQDLPPNQFGYFLVSQDQGTGIIPPGSQGILCVSGNVGRLNRAGEVLFSGAAGDVSMNIDLSNVPQPQGPVSVMAGETWNWQFWYRDNNPTSTSNLSDGNRITFFN